MVCVPGDGIGQAGQATSFVGFGIPRPFNEVAVALRISTVLINGKFFLAMHDQVLKRFRIVPVATIEGDDGFDRFRRICGTPTPLERVFVQFNGNAVQFDCFLNRARGHGDHPRLIGIPQQEHVGGN